MTNAFDWAGNVGGAWAREAARTDRSFAALTGRLHAAILAAAPSSGRAIDIGCGAGETSLALADARPALAVAGVDLSDALVAVAERRRVAVGIANVSFEVDDAAAAAHRHAPLDLFVSRHGVMFFDDPAAAFAALRDAAAPGARLIFSCFAEPERNGFLAVARAAGAGAPHATAPGPFAFSDRERVAAILATAGWTDARATRIDFAYRAGAGADPVADAIDFFQAIGPAAPILRGASPGERVAILDRIDEVVEQHRHGDAVDFPASAWIWSATA